MKRQIAAALFLSFAIFFSCTSCNSQPAPPESELSQAFHGTPVDGIEASGILNESDASVKIIIQNQTEGTFSGNISVRIRDASGALVGSDTLFIQELTSRSSIEAVIPVETTTGLYAEYGVTSVEFAGLAIQDTEPPVLSLSRTHSVYFFEPGEATLESLKELATAHDSQDGDVSASIQVIPALQSQPQNQGSDDFEQQIPGEYVITFVASDAAGNQTTDYVLVRILEPVPDDFQPYAGAWVREDGSQWLITGNYLDIGTSCSELTLQEDGTLCYDFRGIAGTLSLQADGTLLCTSDGASPSSLTPSTTDAFEAYAAEQYQESEAAQEWLEQWLQEGGDSSSQTTITDGMYLVGSDIPAGTYRLTSVDGEMAYWERASSATGDLDDIISNEVFYTTSYVTVYEGNYLTIKGCTGQLQA